MQTDSPTLPCNAEIFLVHRKPMLLIETLDAYNADSFTATVQPLRESPCFSEETEITIECFLELMAQTMAAAHGYTALCSGTSAKTCYIVGIEQFEYNQQTTPIRLLDDKLRTQVTEDMVLGPMKVMRGKVFSQNTVIASATIKVFVEQEGVSENT